MGLVVAVGLADVITVTTVLESVAAVGAVLGVVGTVTKNKALSMAGLALGVVGGVGSLAAGAGLFGADAGASLFGTAPAASTADTAASGAADAAEAASSDTIGSITGDAAQVANPELGGATGFIPGSATSAVPTAAANAADPAASLGAGPAGAVPAGAEMAPEDATALQNSVGAAQASGTNATGLVTSTAPSGMPDTPGIINADTTPGTPMPPTPPDTPPPPGAAPTAAQTPGNWAWGVNGSEGTATIADPSAGDPGMLGGILSFANKNPVVALGMLQSAGSLLSGATSTLTPAQVSALNSQAAANDAAAAFQNQQRANLAMPKSVASSSPVTGTPSPLVPSAPGGFINQPPRQPPITGVPA